MNQPHPFHQTIACATRLTWPPRWLVHFAQHASTTSPMCLAPHSTPFSQYLCPSGSGTSPSTTDSSVSASGFRHTGLPFNFYGWMDLRSSLYAIIEALLMQIVPLNARLLLLSPLRNDSAAGFMVFFFVFGFQILANVYFALGFFGTGAWCVVSLLFIVGPTFTFLQRLIGVKSHPLAVSIFCQPSMSKFSSSGWVAALKAIHYSWFIGVFFIASAGLWTGAIGLCVMMIVRV